VLTIGGWLRYPIIRRLVPEGSRTMLEIGCGRGAMGAILAREFDYSAVEPDRESFEAAARLLDGRVRHAVDTDVSETFDVVCAFEVLEHIEDDEAALRRWRRLVTPGGALILSVPAHQRLYGAVDERVGHFRRYEPDHLTTLLEDAGFGNVDARMYGFGIGHAVRWGASLLARGGGSMEERTAESGRWLQPRGRTATLRRVVAAPFALAQRPLERTTLGTGIVVRAINTDTRGQGQSLSSVGALSAGQETTN